MIVGIIALIIGVLPCVGTFGFIPGLIGVILGTIGLVIAKKSNGRQGGGMAIAGLSTGAVAIILSIVWFVVVGRVTKKLDDVADERNQIREREAEVIKNSAAPSLTAAALATAVDTNRAKAEADYKGRVVELTGTVYRLELDSPPTIQLDAVGDWVVNCNFPTSQTSELRRRLKIGTPVTIRGRVEQINQRGIVLKNCILVN
ncbi:MAG TPA: DUF4190 domain-containing protein [Gemmataceae bacterium]|nr:DUF4190 domain-containing protein [Gemmataceae bacterium]